jgi:hypothetical protein
MFTGELEGRIAPTVTLQKAHKVSLLPETTTQKYFDVITNGNC